MRVSVCNLGYFVSDLGSYEQWPNHLLNLSGKNKKKENDCKQLYPMYCVHYIIIITYGAINKQSDDYNMQQTFLDNQIQCPDIYMETMDTKYYKVNNLIFENKQHIIYSMWHMLTFRF